MLTENSSETTDLKKMTNQKALIYLIQKLQRQHIYYNI